MIQIGRARIQSVQDARRVIDHAPIGKDLTVCVMRDQRKQIVSVQPMDKSSHLREVKRELEMLDLRFRKLLALVQSLD